MVVSLKAGAEYRQIYQEVMFGIKLEEVRGEGKWAIFTNGHFHPYPLHMDKNKDRAFWDNFFFLFT